MIGFLSGKIHTKQPPFLWLDVQGVGYEIEAPMSTFYALPKVGETASLLIHTHVREDAILLFGFASEDEKTLYRTLIKVNGVGAKMALGILSAMSVIEFVNLVESENALGLTKIPGVGKKTAERLVIEMRDKLKGFSSDLSDSGALLSEEAVASSAPPLTVNKNSAVEALVALGYKVNQAEQMVNKVTAESTGLTLEEIIKTALQSIKI